MSKPYVEERIIQYTEFVYFRAAQHRTLTAESCGPGGGGDSSGGAGS